MHPFLQVLLMFNITHNESKRDVNGLGLPQDPQCSITIAPEDMRFQATAPASSDNQEGRRHGGR